MRFKWLLAAAFLIPQHSYAFICNLGTCQTQCTSPTSEIGEQPLPSKPDLNNGNYVDCIYACIDLKQQFSCPDGTAYPWLQGGANDNLKTPEAANLQIYQNGTFRAYVERSFTPLDRDLIKEALEILVEQLGIEFLRDPINSAFGKCTNPLQYDHYQYADLWGANFFDINTYGHANEWRKPREPSWPTIPGAPGIKYDLRIVKLWEDGVLGRAALGSPAVARPVIALNWNNIKGFTKVNGSIQKNSAYSQGAFWATVIAHEMLHTIGANHPDVNWNDPVSTAKYQNTFMVYFAECIGKVALPGEYDPNSKVSTRE